MTACRFKETDDYIEESLSQPLSVLYRDEHLIAVFKPAGLLVHRSDKTLPNEPILLQTLRDQIGRLVFPVHRLDRPTAGIVLFGLNTETAANLVQIFTDRRVDKYYQALVRGCVSERFVIDLSLSEKVDGEWADNSEKPNQVARTEFRRLEVYDAPWTLGTKRTVYSLLEAKPLTGRSHQIRRHLCFCSHPIVGDHRHGDADHNQIMQEQTNVCRMLLTAMRLDFRHPHTQEMLTIVAGRGSEFDRVVAQLRPFQTADFTCLGSDECQGKAKGRFVAP